MYFNQFPIRLAKISAYLLLGKRCFCCTYFITDLYSLALGGVDLEVSAVAVFSMVYFSASFGLAFLCLLVAIPVFLFSLDSKRAKRAGWIVKICVRFVLGNSTVLVAVLGLDKYFE